MLKKYFITGIMLLSLCVIANAQSSPVLDSVKHEIYRINKVFDSSAYLGFSVDISYAVPDPDSPGIAQTYEQQVEYQLNNKNYYYKVDDIEYMQNDSFTVNIDHSQKSMIATKNSFNPLSGSFMLKDFLDNNLAYYDSIYSIVINNIDSVTRVIGFNTNDSLSAYKEIYLVYDIETHQPLKISMKFTAGGKKMELSFLNYKHIPTGEIFDEHNYFYKDRITKRYMPATKYKYYQFITAGIDEDQIENGTQLLKDNSH